jgi:biotin transport system substrate-specific component
LKAPVPCTVHRKKLYDTVLVALFSAIIIICSLITLPFSVPFTLQTFGIYCAVLLLGGKRGTLCIFLYILLGAVGLPVFSGFSGGLGHLFGATGGYITGFLFIGLVPTLFSLLSVRKSFTPLALVSGTVLCYIFGTVRYVLFYSDSLNASEFISVMSICVLPFIIPDTIKLITALFLCRKIQSRTNLFQ